MHLTTGPARVAVLLLASGLLAAGVALPVSTAAAAGAPVPAARSFGPVADDAPHWERENTCSPTAKPGALALRKLLRRTYGTSIGSNIVRGCTGADSGHEEGRAIDWMTDVKVPEQRAMAQAFIAWLQASDSFGNPYAMARRLGVEYLIWNNRMWRTYDPGRGWTEYAGCLAKKKRTKAAYANACHRTHVHISLSWDGAYERTSYFSGFVACPLPAPVPATTPPSTEGLGFVPVPPARLLWTSKGIGMPAGPCRVRGGASYDLPVLGRGGVPADGVAAVMMRVTVTGAVSRTSLRVWPTGAPTPAGAVATAPAGVSASALVTVPVGAGGMVTLQHSAGMAHLAAEVVGYVPTDPSTGDRFLAIDPARVVTDQLVAAGADLPVDLAAAAGATGVDAGLLTVSVAPGAASGGLSASPSDAVAPSLPGLAFGAGQPTTGTVLARTGPDGRTVLRNTSSAAVRVTLDLAGVYRAASSG